MATTKIRRIYERSRIRDIPYSQAASDMTIPYSDSVEGRAVRHYAEGRVRMPDSVLFWGAGPVRNYRLGVGTGVVWIEYFADVADVCSGLDFHCGAKSHMPDVVSRFVEWLGDRLWTAPGDLFDNTLASRFGGGGSPLDECFDAAREALKPKVSTCVVVVPGNHDEWSLKTGALNPARRLADDLGIPYMPGPCAIMLIVNDRLWRIVVEHGRGGGKSDGYKVGSYPLEPLRYKGRTADVSIRAHLHDAQATHLTYFAVDDNGNRSVDLAVGLVAGCALGYEGYPASKCLDPIAPATSGIRLHSTRGIRLDDIYLHDLRK